MELKKTDYTVVAELWRKTILKDKKVGFPLAIDNLQYPGYKDDSIFNYTPSFFIIMKSRYPVAAVSGHRTSSTLYRMRGLFIDDNLLFGKRTKAFNLLLAAIKDQARKENCQYVWDLLNPDHEVFNYGVEKGEKFGDKIFGLIKL